MGYLSFIDDEKFENIVLKILDRGVYSIKNAQDKFARNVIDPFSILFEMSSFNIDSNKWVENETMRQAQKSLSNHIGDFHQKLLGSFNGWECLSTGEIIDGICYEKKIIAEIKNKHNTLKGSDRSAMYYKLDDLIMKKGHKYKDFTAYYVEIIPKKPARYNLPFTPSDSSKGTKCPVNEKIRMIDGYSFYALASGVDNALEQIFNALPLVIQKVKPSYKFINHEEILTYFNSAFLGK